MSHRIYDSAEKKHFQKKKIAKLSVGYGKLYRSFCELFRTCFRKTYPPFISPVNRKTCTARETTRKQREIKDVSGNKVMVGDESKRLTCSVLTDLFGENRIRI